MIRFFTQMHPKVPLQGLSVLKYPECVTTLKGSFVSFTPPRRNYVERGDKEHPQKEVKAREEKQQMRMPGFVHPDPMSDEGLLTQKVRQQIEEHKKKKDKPTLQNPDGRE